MIGIKSRRSWAARLSARWNRTYGVTWRRIESTGRKLARKDARKTAWAAEERGDRRAECEKEGGRGREEEKERMGVQVGRPTGGEGEVGIAIKAICCIVPAIRRRQLSPTVLTSSQGLSAAVEHVCFIDLAPLRALPSNVAHEDHLAPTRNLAHGSGA